MTFPFSFLEGNSLLHVVCAPSGRIVLHGRRDGEAYNAGEMGISFEQSDLQRWWQRRLSPEEVAKLEGRPLALAPVCTRYVAGLMFDEARQHVALIRKAKPSWQAGKLNGIGGKIEPGESAAQAMVREFMEETGSIHPLWTHFLHMYGINDCGQEGFSVDFFFTTGDLERLQSLEDETIETHPLAAIHVLRDDMIENLPWLIALAFDCSTDGRPMFVMTHYSLSPEKAMALHHE